MAMAMNPIQVLKQGAEEEKAETARLSSFIGNFIQFDFFAYSRFRIAFKTSKLCKIRSNIKVRLLSGIWLKVPSDPEEWTKFYINLKDSLAMENPGMKMSILNLLLTLESRFSRSFLTTRLLKKPCTCRTDALIFLSINSKLNNNN